MRSSIFCRGGQSVAPLPYEKGLCFSLRACCNIVLQGTARAGSRQMLDLCSPPAYAISFRLYLIRF